MNEQVESLKTYGYNREEVMEIFGRCSKEPQGFATHCVNGFYKPAAFEAGDNFLWDEFEKRERK